MIDIDRYFVEEDIVLPDTLLDEIIYIKFFLGKMLFILFRQIKFWIRMKKK